MKISDMKEAGVKSMLKGKKTSKYILFGCRVAVCVLALSIAVGNLDWFVDSGQFSQQSVAAGVDDSAYFAPIVAMASSGSNELQYPDGSIYKGNLSGDQRNGRGTLTWSNGDVFSGTWSSGNMVSGTYTFADGRKYEGSFQNNLFSTGSFELGSTCRMQGLSSYTARYENGKVTSLKFETLDGLKYDGDVTGKAKITYENGDSYSGEVYNGSRNGYGTYIWYVKGGEVASYIGDWQDGVMSGSGTYYYTKSEYPYITGKFLDGKPDGIAYYYKSKQLEFLTRWYGGKCQYVI